MNDNSLFLTYSATDGSQGINRWLKWIFEYLLTFS